ncbi:MAG: hypothetical protein ACO1QB_02335 [Verrucomicrobiales bacterium]
MNLGLCWKHLLAAFTLAVPLSGDAAEENPHVPAGYQLVYQQDFETGGTNDFIFSDSAAWQVSADAKGNKALELKAQSKYQPPVRSPVNIALLKDKSLGDFILEADLIQTGKEYGHRDMCLYFGFQEAAKFYYTHIATAADDHAHNIFIVKDQPRTKIAHETTKGVNWGLEVWHKVRLQRTASTGEIKVFYDDMSQPIMVANDTNFPSGFVGFGSFDDTGKVDNIKIWAPRVEAKSSADLFKKR